MEQQWKVTRKKELGSESSYEEVWISLQIKMNKINAINLFIFYKVKIKLKCDRPIENTQHIFVEKEMNASMNNVWHCNGW